MLLRNLSDEGIHAGSSFFQKPDSYEIAQLHHFLKHDIFWHMLPLPEQITFHNLSVHSFFTTPIFMKIFRLSLYTYYKHTVPEYAMKFFQQSRELSSDKNSRKVKS